MSSPNPNYLRVGISIMRSLRTIDAPRPTGTGGVEAADFGVVLAEVAGRGPGGLPTLVGDLERVIKGQGEIDPDEMSPNGALAFWLNLYNAGALALAGRASLDSSDSVLRVPGAFTRPFVTVAGEVLSLDAVEHAKVRRFGDPRIHGALVCGAVSCPTLRTEPYDWTDLDDTLDEQMRSFLARAGAVADRDAGVLRLSQIFSWFSGDFVRPTRMPTFVPGSRRALVEAISPWLDADTAAWARATSPRVEFQRYDWGLRCSVG